MPRYFIEVAYKGTNYAGFQVQQNANTVQAEVQQALNTYFRSQLPLTGSSRTDAGVHAASNFFHFDSAEAITSAAAQKAVYHLNAMLPGDIVAKSIRAVGEQAHCRFDARVRTYQYSIYHLKDPFLADRAWYYPYPLDISALNEAAALLTEYSDFRSFSKKNTQNLTHDCDIMQSSWEQRGATLVFTVSGNRFLRGMVRGLTATMLQVGRGRMNVDAFRTLIERKDAYLTDFSAPSCGLILLEVRYPAEIFI